MSPWTQEPWRITGKYATEPLTNHEVIKGIDPGIGNNGIEEANVSRAVACVNGCAGLNPDAYRGMVEALKMILKEETLSQVNMGILQGVLAHATVSHA